jgi:hypothetical protein
MRQGICAQVPSFHSLTACCWVDERYDTHHTFTAPPDALVVINFTLSARYLANAMALWNYLTDSKCQD